MCDLLRLFCSALIITAVFPCAAEGIQRKPQPQKLEKKMEKTRFIKTDYSHRVVIGSHVFLTEIADTPEKMQTGMMFRENMAKNQAMLFVYPYPQAMTFWMKNTRVSLDMLFFNADGILQEIKSNVPPCQTVNCPTYSAKQEDNQFVMELKGGVAKTLNITVGDRLR